MTDKIKSILTIAGSDSSAGAGIQSDLKTFRNHGLYGLTVITQITAQNTHGVQKSFALSNSIVSEQLRSVMLDFKFNVVKTGVLPGGVAIKDMCLLLKKIKNLKLVVDPVLFSKNNFNLINKSGLIGLKKHLMKIAYLLTPNLFEAGILSGINIRDIKTVELAMKKLYSFGPKNVLLKGGHFDKSPGIRRGTDILFNGKKFFFFTAPYIKTKNTHGIGCTFSAAIASNLALGYDLISSIKKAKEYVIHSLQRNIKIGSGIGPVEI